MKVNGKEKFYNEINLKIKKRYQSEKIVIISIQNQHKT